MTATAHALVSGAIAAAIPNPIVSLSLAFVSHFIMDIIPHWDFGTNWRGRSKYNTGLIAIIDTVLGFTLTYFIFLGKVDPLILLGAMVMGNLPDWLEAPYYIFFAKQNTHALSPNATFWETVTYRIYRFENIFHSKAQFPFGLVTQVLTVVFFISLLSFAV